MKIFNITSYQENANQNHSKCSLTLIKMDIIKKMEKKSITVMAMEKGELIH